MRTLLMSLLCFFLIKNAEAQNEPTGDVTMALEWIKDNYHAQNPRPTDRNAAAQRAVHEQLTARSLDAIAATDALNSTGIANVNVALGALSGTMTVASNLVNLYNAFQTLGNSECTPDFSTSSNAQMTSTCQNNESCDACYNRATEKMDFYRRQLARLNCIYKNTTSFTASAIAFGDNVSGLHAMSGLAWQTQRGKIVGSLKKLKITYDKKYTEFITGLMNSLMEFDACETRYGSGDWFQKSGFIYFEFMKEKYKRND